MYPNANTIARSGIPSAFLLRVIAVAGRTDDCWCNASLGMAQKIEIQLYQEIEGGGTCTCATLRIRPREWKEGRLNVNVVPEQAFEID